MRYNLLIAASTIAIATVGAGPALAHDRPPGPKAAKAGSIRLTCRPEAARPASVRCAWSAPHSEGTSTFRYELSRKVLGAEGRPAVVSTGTNREFRDVDVVGGTRYAYKVTALHENARPVARSRVVVVRCCDERPSRPSRDGAGGGGGRGGGGKPDATENRDSKPPEPSRLALQCRASSANDRGAVACDWAGLPGDKVAGYRLYRKAASGRPVVVASFPGGGTTSFVDGGVAPATTYWYAVEAKSVDGRGTRSNIVEVRCCP